MAIAIERTESIGPGISRPAGFIVASDSDKASSYVSLRPDVAEPSSFLQPQTTNKPNPLKLPNIYVLITYRY